MKILIIEDEARTAVDLAQTLKKINPQIMILNILDSISSTVTYLKTNSMPDLIYMDIQLSDGPSFDIFKEVNITCPVIFCTAYDEYAVESFKMNGIYFILKPFDMESIGSSLAKVDFLKSHYQMNYSNNEPNNTLFKTLPQINRSSFLVHHKGKMFPVPVTDIAYFFIADELSFIFTFKEQKYIIDHSLEELEKMIDPNKFYRANRQFLVNFEAIKEVEPYFNRKLLIKLSVQCNTSIIVSKLKKTEFQAWLSER